MSHDTKGKVDIFNPGEYLDPVKPEEIKSTYDDKDAPIKAEVAFNAAYHLLLKERIFDANILIQLRRSWEPCGSAYVTLVNGRYKLAIDPVFFLNLPNLDAQKELLIHEIEHLWRDHIGQYIEMTGEGTKVLRRSMHLWNCAADMAINQRLPNLKEFICYDNESKKFIRSESQRHDSKMMTAMLEKYNMTALPDQTTDYYHLLLIELSNKMKKDPDNRNNNGKGIKVVIKSGRGNGQNAQDGSGGGDKIVEITSEDLEELLSSMDNHDKWTESESDRSVSDNSLYDVLNKAAEATKNDSMNNSGAGSVPLEVRKFLESSKEAKVRWEKQLRSFVAATNKCKRESTRNKRNRRYGLWSPGKIDRYKLKLLIGWDVSGSMSGTEEMILSELKYIAQTGIDLHILTCDTQIHESFKFDPKKSKLEISGGGGTSYDPIFEEAKKIHADGIIVFGDMYVNKVTCPRPRVPVLWAVVNSNAEPPAAWGRKINVKK